MVSAFSIPQGKRQDSEHKDGPGPGAYQLREKVDGSRPVDPRYSIGRSRREEPQRHNDMPGPGQYKYDRSKVDVRAPAYSILSKPQKNEHPEPKLIGPGLYSPNYAVTKESAPHYSLPKLPRGADYNPAALVPGPGAYNGDKQTLLAKVARNIHFGTQSREDKSSSLVPGPGAYDPSLKHRAEAPKVGMGLKVGSGDKQAAFIPGPGAYNPAPSTFSKVGGLISKLKNSSIVATPQAQIPGPGAYNANFQKLAKNEGSSKFGKAGRGELLSSSTPGPGNYPVQKINSISNLRDQAIKFGKQARDGPNLKHSQDIPGPGQYYSDHYDSLASKSGGGIAITKERRLNNYGANSLIPGPGAYSPNPEVIMPRDRATKIVTVKSPSAPALPSPGPGAYSYGMFKPSGGGGVSFGKDAKLRMGRVDGPGPGQYDYKVHFADVPKYLLPNGPTKSRQMGLHV